jgi:hypothetical protein
MHSDWPVWLLAGALTFSPVWVPAAFGWAIWVGFW